MENGVSASDITMEDYLHAENKKANALYLAGAFMAQVGILLAVTCALTTYQLAPNENDHLFTVNNWPNTISSLIYNLATTYGRVFYAFVIIAGILVLFSWRFTYSMTMDDENFGDTIRMYRHIIISAGILVLVLVPTSEEVHPGTPVVIMEVVHYVGAGAAVLLHPISEIWYQWKNADDSMTRREKIRKMWGSWAVIALACAFVAIRLTINILHYNNSTVSNAYPITSFVLEYCTITAVMINAWYSPY